MTNENAQAIVSGKRISVKCHKLDILNLGCGLKKLPHAINVDISESVSPEMILDLNRIPWPFPSESFSEVFASDVIEHCNDVIRIMEEVHRVSRENAIVHITVPHFSCVNSFADPTHRHLFSASSFRYLTAAHDLSFYSRARFRNQVTSVIFHPTLVNKLIGRLANRWPDAYERRWAWIFPAWFIYFELEVLRSPTKQSLQTSESRQ